MVKYLYCVLIVVALLNVSQNIEAQVCVTASGTPSANRNYISTRIFKIPDVKTDNDLNLTGRTVCQVNQTIQYFDGLSRPVQEVTAQGSGTFRDIVQPLTYDVFGRENKKYLPYVAPLAQSNGSYKTTDLADQVSFYNNPTAQSAPGVTAIAGAAFSETSFEASPLNRPLEQGAPGSSWQVGGGHTIRLTYGNNNSDTNYGASTGFAVRLYQAQPVSLSSAERTLTSTGFYSANQLYLTISKDENWVPAYGKAGTVEEYKDKADRVVLKRTFNLSAGQLEILSTYYVYDDLGNLSFVLPPGSNPDAGGISTDVLNKFCYQYRYDARQRLIEKWIPSTSNWNNLVYNKLDQLILSQDAQQQLLGKWMYTKYDALGRTIGTGVYTSTATRSAVQALADASSVQWETRGTSASYSNVSFPLSNTDIYTVNYYDDYTFASGTLHAFINASVKTRGLLTGSNIKVLDGNLQPMLLSWNFYDEEGRLVKNFKEHYLSGTRNENNYDETQFTYNFTGEQTASTRIHRVGTIATTIATRNVFDHKGRKLSSWESINGAAEVGINKLAYNEVGQLLNKSLHSTDQGSSYLQNTVLSYNERGWLKSSNSSQFSLELKYNDGTVPQYNGNIANQLWGASGSNSNVFTYGYDKLNRLLSGVSTGIAMSELFSYDPMGNIKSLNRQGVTGTYSYNGNRLNGITGWSDVPGIYEYNANGSVVKDGKGVTITYNMLNLPATAVKTGVNLSYIYDATGNKLRKTSSGIIRNYIDGIEYNSADIELIHTEDGFARKSGTVYSYEYNLNDHLGNVRYTFNKSPVNGLLTRLQQTNYYPFGKENFIAVGDNKYLYNGKELQQELGQLDYGARFYDPVIARFITIDPLAENFPWMTPFQYASNDPIKNIDLDGMEGLPFFLEPALMFGNSSVTPKLGPLGEVARLSPENIVKAGGEFSAKTLEAFKKGNVAEAEQLSKNGLDKNYRPIKEIDPKTGQEGKTIPDAFTNDGKSTVEIKHVKNQSFTKQLRMQEKYSNDNGFSPELIINKGAKISQPLKKSSFDIKTYETAPKIKLDNTKVVTPQLTPIKPPKKRTIIHFELT